MAGAGRLNGRGPLVAGTRIPAQAVSVESTASAESTASVAPLGPILRFRLAALLAAQLFDFGTFTLMINKHGIAAEANPLVAQGFATFGLPVLVLVKVALVVLLGSIVVLLARDAPSRRAVPGLAALITVLAVVGGLAGGISNVLAS